MTPAEFLPELRPWVENLVNVWPAYVIKPQFASWQVLHILSLVVLGGCTILLNLRLIGVGLTEEPASEIDRNLRLWLNLGVVSVLITGVLIGMANAERLYDSAAFTVKMFGLVAALIFTYGVTNRVARSDGAVSLSSKIAALAALALWSYALWVFTTAQLINPGMFHLITAAGLVVLFAVRGRARWIYLAGLGLLIAVQWVWTHLFLAYDDIARLDPVNKGFAWAFAAWIIAIGLHQLFTAGRDQNAGPLTKLVGYTGILMWVSVAAAGRWIAFA